MRGEREKHKIAFEYYYSLGDSRSLAKVAQKMGYSNTTIKAWSKKYNWIERVEQREAKQRDKLAQETNETLEIIKANIRSNIKNYQNVITALINRAINKINRGELAPEKTSDVYQLLLAYEKLTRLELNILGEDLGELQISINRYIIDGKDKDNQEIESDNEQEH